MTTKRVRVSSKKHVPCKYCGTTIQFNAFSIPFNVATNELHACEEYIRLRQVTYYEREDLDPEIIAEYEKNMNNAVEGTDAEKMEARNKMLHVNAFHNKSMKEEKLCE